MNNYTFTIASLNAKKSESFDKPKKELTMLPNFKAFQISNSCFYIA